VQEPVPTHIWLAAMNPWSFWITGLLVVAIWWVVWTASSIIYLIVTAMIVSMAMESMIVYFQKWISRWWAIAIAYILVVLFVLSWVLLIVPLVVWQLTGLVTLFIEQVSTWQSVIQDQWLVVLINEWSLPNVIKEPVIEYLTSQDVGVALQQSLSENMGQLVSIGTSSLGDASGFVVALIAWVFSTVAQWAIVLVCSVFFSLEKRRVVSVIASVAQESEKLENVLLRLYDKLWSWLKGQLILCLSIGVMAWVWLIILGRLWISLPNKFSLALMAWLTEFIPYIGPLLGMIPALLIGITEFGIRWFVWVVILYALIQQLEWNILVPMVMYHTLGVSPLLIFLCMILWWTLFGFLWVLLAVPLAVIINILYMSYSTTHRTIQK
jgi:predicted PurR-regulated permease PerM